MASGLSAFIDKTLCDHRGCLDFRRLEEAIKGSFVVSEVVLRSVLFDDSKIAIQAGKQKATAGQIISPDSLVVAKTSLRICHGKTGQCPQCDGLHLCRFYVLGACSFGQKCKKSHILASPYNQALLMKYGLQYLTEKQLFQLLLQNDPYLLPEICPHYNRGSGEHGSCKFSTSCTKLHICQHYFQNDCKFGTLCKRSHNIYSQGMKLFRGVSQENINDLHEIYRNKLIIMGQWITVVPVPPEVKIPKQKPPHQAAVQPSHSNPGSPTSSACPSKSMNDADKNEICLFFIRRHCSFSGNNVAGGNDKYHLPYKKCVRVHWHLPYTWQVLDTDGVTWKDLPDMESIEKAYCDPGQDTSCMSQELHTAGIFNFFGLRSSLPPVAHAVDFLSMKYGSAAVRRLSTASSVSKPPHFILTTQWIWYWKDENGKWQEYGQGDGDTQASVTSETLEKMYLAERHAEIPFGAAKQQYLLHFKGGPGTYQMYQENLKYKTKREVRRRPRFVSAHDVKVKLERVSAPSSSSSAAKSVPSHWDKNALPDFGYKLVPLTKSESNYDMIEMLFRRTMPKSKINSIQRIQNPSLWKVFQWQKEQIKEKNGGTLVNQQYLFHGTDESLIDAICEQNFDWRMCGVHGTALGKGSYFARDASYSDRYARIKGGLNKIMFVALVLLGEFCAGRSDYVRPPPKGNGRTLYDSCVDCVSDPSIYVVFEKQQIYPEYLISYS